MKKLSLEQMEKIEGGKMSNCTVAYIGLGLSTISLFAAPFTGGISLGLVAFGSFVTSAYGAETC